MNLPKEIVLLRHGESEGNIAAKLSAEGINTLFTPEFVGRAGYKWRLSPTGITQAKKAGGWMRKNNLVEFDFCVHSDMYRAKETAYYAHNDEYEWFENYLVREQHWGLLDTSTEAEKQNGKYGRCRDLRNNDPFFWTPPGGESMEHVVERIKLFLAQLPRYEEVLGKPVKKLHVVCHGHTMRCFRHVIENMNPEQFASMWRANIPINNCHIIHYRDYDGEKHHQLRMVDTQNEADDTGWLAINQ